MSEFDQKARDWDKNRMHLERTEAVAKLLQELIPLRPDMRAMEFGAGTGLLSFSLKEHFKEITLMDSSREMLNMAGQKMEPSDRSKFKTLFLNLEKEEYTGEPFDIIYSQMVLHHILDTRAILNKFYNMLAAGGVLAIADLYTEDGSFHDGAPDVHHGFDPGTLKEIFLQQGFGDWEILPCYVMKKELPGGTLKEYPVFLLTAVKISD